MGRTSQKPTVAAPVPDDNDDAEEMEAQLKAAQKGKKSGRSDEDTKSKKKARTEAAAEEEDDVASAAAEDEDPAEIEDEEVLDESQKSLRQQDLAVDGEIAGVKIAELHKLYTAEKLWVASMETKADAIASTFEVESDVALRIANIKQAMQAKVSRQRAKAKVSGYARLAAQAGYGKLSNKSETRAQAGATDSLHSLLTLSDAVRLANSVPAQPDEPSFKPEEYAARVECMGATLPADAARVVVANVEKLFKHAVNASVAMAAHEGRKTVKPSHMMHVLKPIYDNLRFSALSPPIGLLKYAVDADLVDEDAMVSKVASFKKAAKKTSKMHGAKVESIEERKAIRKQPVKA